MTLAKLTPLLIAGFIPIQPSSAALPYSIPDTGQNKCYDDRQVIKPPRPEEAFYGQDAQFQGPPAEFRLSPDKLTVFDAVTGLTWQRSPDTDGDGRLKANDKLNWAQAQVFPSKLNAARFGGYNDWRLPSIKELYSLFDGRGIDPSGPVEPSSSLLPFIDTNYFGFSYGDPAAGERLIDAQYASATLYVGESPRGGNKLFGVNFADGRIKGYDLQMPGGRREKTFFVLCVRGNAAYGKNNFNDNKNGTITDLATGLTWAREDSGKAMNWRQALAWVQERNKTNYLGHNDWRLPNVKELQSVVDYTRSPDTTRSAAIHPVFQCSSITNEAGRADFPFYWSSTTHAGLRGGDAAMYVAFGRASGWMPQDPFIGGRAGPPPQGHPIGAAPPGKKGNASIVRYVDVHGAGAQRSDPKSGDPGMFPRGRGPQGDVIRIYNFVRPVRGPGRD